MAKTLDPAQYRDVLHLVFPAGVAGDATVACTALNAQFGRWTGMTAMLDGLRVTQQQPSGLLVRRHEGRVVGLWAPLSVANEQLVQWRAGIERALTVTGTTQATGVLLSAGRIEHRWNLPRSGLRLFSPPAGAPRAPMQIAEHPGLIQMHLETFGNPLVTSRIAGRLMERRTMLLNLATYLRCRDASPGRSAWGRVRGRDDRSRWMDLDYYSPELSDPGAVERASARAPEGRFVDDHEYYVEYGDVCGEAAVLPVSLDETLAAAELIGADNQRDLWRACRWVQAADQTSVVSSSLSFVALASAIETLAKNWMPSLRATVRFKRFLTEMLPCYAKVEHAAAELYRLRCKLVHEGLVFPDDWMETGHDEDITEFSSWWALARVGRLAAVNWLRERAGLPKLGSHRA